MLNDHYYMNFALSLANMAYGQTSPNPPVGAIVVRKGEVLGFGAHLKAGNAHAEVYALQMAGSKAMGATLYVTLEPCSHYGETAPCVDLIIEMGVQRVVVAMVDPNERVKGKGIVALEKAGIEVDVGVSHKEAQKMNEAFSHFVETKTPFVTVKTATSLDGKTATVTGESKWITGKEARLDVHHHRHLHDAILVGVNTVIVDNPSLTTRLPNGGKNAVRVILDTHLRTPVHAKVITDKESDTWIFTGCHVSEKQKKMYAKHERIQIITLETETVSIKEVLKILGQNGIMSLFVEGGAEIHGSFLKEKRINQLIAYIAPKLLGGKKAAPSIAGEGFQSIADSWNLSIDNVERVGEDIKITAVPERTDSDVYGDY
ncbi:bifunctional diaminohydroxyphosphoribosylaminopyrimidine deaminase/5-amino-6-(5-phosphoribosylamino)uracil reductase RibD [Virgibacillus sp. W0181]|uniref:bifunctional diaminohydroxyphosphoribosylaminopyrimidine deaminase/5-amino-6-(5-phosphoribosylamino)uracil reductase RibD n=1 Tax=Virgibacillus sp. W0181 TaxID=3391581 RepID=UPI003F456636